MIEKKEMGRREFLTTVGAGALAGGLAGGLVAIGNSRWSLVASAAGDDRRDPPKPPNAGSEPGLGVGASLGGRRIFPADNAWNQDISGEPVDPNSDTLVAGIGLDKTLHPDFGTVYEGVPLGIPYVVVSGKQPRVPIRLTTNDDESDPGPYPVPPNAPVEGGRESKGDRHVLVLDRDNWKLYEMVNAFPDGEGWKAESGAIFDLNSNELRKAGWTSANAAGLPILPGLVRYDEVIEQKAIRHALAFTCTHTRRAYVSPARHFASSSKDEKLPPMGMRVRLKADFNVSPFPASVQVILVALKKYGMFLAQNGGDWYMNGAPDPRWNDKELSTLKKVKGRDLEVVKMGALTTG
jgi:hypothetical protein